MTAALRRSVHGVGTHDTTLVTLRRPLAMLQALLPPEPLIEPDLEDGQGWLVLSFGHQSGVRPSFVSGPSLRYHELIMALPNTHHRRFPELGPFIFMPRLYLDRLYPVILGYFYGFSKYLARVERSPGRYRVQTLRGPMIELYTSSAGVQGALEDFPILEERGIAAGLRQPLLGRTLVGCWLWSRMDWHLETASIRPVQASLVFHRPFAPGLSLSPQDIAGMDPGGEVAFHLENRWTLTTPRLLGRAGETP